MTVFDKAAYDWCKALRQRSIEDLQAFKLGLFSMRRDDGDGWTDATQEHIATLERQIAKLEELIAVYERQDTEKR